MTATNTSALETGSSRRRTIRDHFDVSTTGIDTKSSRSDEPSENKGSAFGRAPAKATTKAAGKSASSSTSRRRPQAKRPASGAKARKAKSEQKSKLTDYFVVRSSSRISAKKDKAENFIRDENDRLELFEIREEPIKGKCVFAARPFENGDFVCEYAGDLLTAEEATEREAQYQQEHMAQGIETPMCYMYFFRYNERRFCVDATRSKRLGRLINHSSKSPNLKTKLFVVDGKPHLGLVATRWIKQGEELLYDYGERDPAVLAAHPWLRT